MGKKKRPKLKKKTKPRPARENQQWQGIDSMMEGLLLSFGCEEQEDLAGTFVPTVNHVSMEAMDKQDCDSDEVRSDCYSLTIDTFDLDMCMNDTTMPDEEKGLIMNADSTSVVSSLCTISVGAGKTTCGVLDTHPLEREEAHQDCHEADWEILSAVPTVVSFTSSTIVAPVSSYKDIVLQTNSRSRNTCRCCTDYLLDESQNQKASPPPTSTLGVPSSRGSLHGDGNNKTPQRDSCKEKTQIWKKLA